MQGWWLIVLCSSNSCKRGRKNFNDDNIDKSFQLCSSPFPTYMTHFFFLLTTPRMAMGQAAANNHVKYITPLVSKVEEQTGSSSSNTAAHMYFYNNDNLFLHQDTPQCSASNVMKHMLSLPLHLLLMSPGTSFPCLIEIPFDLLAGAVVLIEDGVEEGD